jgi:general stress protein CsbA
MIWGLIIVGCIGIILLLAVFDLLEYRAAIAILGISIISILAGLFMKKKQFNG